MTSPNMKSPGQWRSPADVMNLRRLKSKKKILDMRMKRIAQDLDDSIDDASTSSKDEQHKELRMNPFRCSPWKRQRSSDSCPSVSSESDDVSCDSSLLQLLETSACPPPVPIHPSTVQPSCPPNAEPIPAGIVTWHSQLPFDWSLKTSLRFISIQPFPWNSVRLTTVEQASGITGYVRCLPLGCRLDDAREKLALDTSPNAQLFQCCQVWMHPALPWLKLFPRHQTRVVATTPMSNPIMAAQMHESLQADWTESFQSLFHLLRARQCPYFYVCAQLFTALFRAPGVGANPRMHALITPTTRGFRSALTKEGVHFTLPLCKAEQQSGSTDDDDEIILNDEANSFEGKLPEGCDEQQEDVVNWLKSVGVEDKMLAQLDQDTSSLTKEKEIDYRPLSLVCIEDSHVHALFNFLLNSKSCVASSGPFVGIPPTLLAPVAFTGATLRPLKIRQQRAKKFHIFDVIGPILPHTVHYLDQLLKARSHSAVTDTLAYDVHLSTLEATVPFSMYSQSDDGDVPPAVFGQQSLSDCGLDGHVLETMCSQHEGNVLRHVTVDSGRYRWTS